MNDESARIFLEDWFAANLETTDCFSGEALDVLPDIVEAALHGAVAVSPDDARVTTLLLQFLSAASASVRAKDPKARIDVTRLGDDVKRDCRRVIAAVLTLEERRKGLLERLSATQVSVSSVSRMTGMARSSFMQARSPLLNCLMEFMAAHAGAPENRSRKTPDASDLRRKVDELAAEIREMKLASAEKDLFEVRYRRSLDVIEQQRRDIEAHMAEKRAIAEKYVRLRDIALAHGINVPVELDADEKIDAAAAAYKMWKPGDGIKS